MKFKSKEAEQEWEEGWEKNTDFYGRNVYTYSKRWAEMMEAELAGGASLESFAKESSHEANEEQITGFQYGCAVNVLSNTWVHGEELRRWHNLDAQFGTEGEEANREGGVLNPAIITVKGKEPSE